MNLKNAEVINQRTGEKWVYSPIVKDHFFHPRNLLLETPKPEEFDAEGVVGSPACGDVMHMWIKADRATDRITDLKWKTFGCGSAIAATSMFSLMVTENGGIKIEDALRIRPQDVMARLGGLPDRKVHCSVLADKAFRKAVNEYFRITGQRHRIIIEGARVVDKRVNITDKDIEEAVIEGARTLEDVRKRLKVGVCNPEATPEIEQTVEFYKGKFYKDAVHPH